MKSSLSLKNPKLAKLLLGAGFLGSATMAMATSDYGPAVNRLITGCPKWYTSGYGKRFVVIHDMEGYYLTSISYLSRCDVTASVHYCVNGKSDNGTDAAPGEISQLVTEAN